MSLLTGSWLVDILLFVTTLLFMLYLHIAAKYRYFSSRGIPYYNNSIIDRFYKLGFHTVTKAYENMKSERFFGIFLLKYPLIVVKDPELVHRILVKDFDHFYDRGMPSISDDDFLISQGLFSLNGAVWKSIRNKLLPTFTSGKLKHMFSQFLTCGEHFLEDMKKSVEPDIPVDGKILVTDFAIEVVASTAFGIDFSKNNPQSAELASRLRNLFIPPGIMKGMLFFIIQFFPFLKQWIKLSACAPGSEEYFVNLTKATKQYRKENNIIRNDYFQLLIALQENDRKGKTVLVDKDELTEEDRMLDQMQYAPVTSHSKTDDVVFNDEMMTAQVLFFMNGGTENIAFTVTMALYHIAKDREIQRKLQDEIGGVTVKQGSLTYQGVKDLAYMDQVLQETLRMYPVLPGTLRECMVPYTIPGSDIVLEKGTRVYIPIVDIQMDPQYYPEPHKFNPDRFIGNNHKQSSIYLPFGDGPRICIAMRFSVLEMKICLLKILSEFTVEVSGKTQEPILFEPYPNVPPRPVGGVWFDFKKRI